MALDLPVQSNRHATLRTLRRSSGQQYAVAFHPSPHLVPSTEGSVLLPLLEPSQ